MKMELVHVILQSLTEKKIANLAIGLAILVNMVSEMSVLIVEQEKIEQSIPLQTVPLVGVNAKHTFGTMIRHAKLVILPVYTVVDQQKLNVDLVKKELENLIPQTVVNVLNLIIQLLIQLNVLLVIPDA